MTIDPASRIDLDNGIKLLIDTAREYGLVPDDSPKCKPSGILVSEDGVELDVDQLTDSMSMAFPPPAALPLARAFPLAPTIPRRASPASWREIFVVPVRVQLSRDRHFSIPMTNQQRRRF